MSRRLLVAAAVTHYVFQPDWDRPELAEDVARMTELLHGRFGYEPVPLLPADPTAEHLHTRLRSFARSCELDDYVVLYLAAHGDITGRGEHVLLPADTDPDDPLGRAVKTSSLAELMLDETPLHRLMLVLDSCYAGAGSAGMASQALEAWSGLGSVVVITATRPGQQAQPGVFTQAFARATCRRAVAGYAAPALAVDALVDQIHKDAAVPATHAATCVQIGAGEDLWFLPNPDFQPRLADLDIDTQERLWHQLGRDLADRFVPATHWFTGRRRALADLTAWLTAPDRQDEPRCQVVTGGPGSGKTAVLGLLAALSDPSQRPAVPMAGLPDVLPPSRVIDAAIYVGTQPTTAVLAQIAAAAGLQLPEHQDRAAQIRHVLDGLTQRERPLIVLIDALDEAADPKDWHNTPCDP